MPPLFPIHMGRARGPFRQADARAGGMASQRKRVGSAAGCEYCTSFPAADDLDFVLVSLSLFLFLCFCSFACLMCHGCLGVSPAGVLSPFLQAQQCCLLTPTYVPRAALCSSPSVLIALDVFGIFHPVILYRISGYSHISSTVAVTWLLDETSSHNPAVFEPSFLLLLLLHAHFPSSSNKLHASLPLDSE